LDPLNDPEIENFQVRWPTKGPIDYFRPFETNQFLLFEKVVLTTDRTERDDDFAPLFRACNFNSVERLVVAHYYEGDGWPSAFPNLKELVATVEHRDGLLDILATMKGLENLTIRIGRRNFGDLNPGLFEGLRALVSLKGNRLNIVYFLTSIVAFVFCFKYILV